MLSLSNNNNNNNKSDQTHVSLSTPPHPITPHPTTTQHEQHNRFEVAKGSHIYEFGDHGALIVMAKDLAVTDTLYYSWSEGSQWQSLRFVNTPMEVVNIIVEPETTSQRFIVYGARKNPVDGSPQGVLVHVDFSNLHE